MDPSQLTLGQKVAGGAGLVLLISLFLPWYGVDLGLGGDVTATGWEVFSYTDLIVFLTGAVAVAVAVLATQNKLAALPVPAGQLVLGLGAVALVFVLFRTINPPGPSEVDLGRKFGLFLGLIASAGVAYAGSLLSKE